MISSFSEKIKAEILNYKREEGELKFLINSFLYTNGSFNNDKFTLKTSLKKHKKLLITLIQKFYDFKIEVSESKTIIKITINDPSFKEIFLNEIEKTKLKKTEDYKAYISGVFLGKGWVSSPSSKFYHFEIRIKKLSDSLNIQEAFDALGIKSSIFKKNNWYYTYIKKASVISDILKVMKAPESLILFEDTRIEREFISIFKKMESIEIYNIAKIEKASKTHIEAIRKLMGQKNYQFIPIKIKELLELRIENPALSLSELQIVYNKKFNYDVSKSSVNKWLQNIINISKE